MHSSKPSRKPQAPGPESPPAYWPWPVDGDPQRWAVTGEGAAVLFRGLGEMGRIQQRTALQVVQRHAAAGEQLRAAHPPDVFALQAELLQRDLQDAAQCWQQLSDTALETTAELWGCATHMVNTEDAFGAATRLFRA